MKVDTEFPESSPCEITNLSERHVRCRLTSEGSGSQFFHFCVRITGLAPGETATVEVVWPRRWTPDDLPPDANDEAVRRMTSHDSFVTVLPSILMQSPDLDEWRPVTDVTLDEATDTLTMRVIGAETPDSRNAPIYICSQIPYRTGYHDALLAHVRDVAPDTLHGIGRSQAGEPLYVIALDATGSEPGDAPTVYVQALQHHSEHTGAFVADTLVRYLLDDPAGRALREKINWEIMPAFDPDGLYGRVEEARLKTGTNLRAKNPNRDWDVAEWPEVAAVKAWWDTRIAMGRSYALCLDLHNGWSNRRSTGACYTVDEQSPANADYVAAQKAFIDWMYARTDHEVGRYWCHQLPFGMCCKEAFHELTGGLGFTVEFSRYKWWSREKQAYEPTHPDHPRRFAHDAARAVADWFDR